MGVDALLRNLRSAKNGVDAIAAAGNGPESRARIADLQRRLARAVEATSDLRDEVFLLQEQNQQLRRDLSDKVCPRLCNHPRGCAS
jgi:hypothetical protein